MTGPSRAGLLPTSWGQSGGSWWSERKCLQGQVPQVAEVGDTQAQGGGVG